MINHARRAFTPFAFCLLSGLGAVSLTGCRVTEQDISRWETTEHGPEKLVAVLTHDKYDWDLRRDAALALVKMRPRGGQRLGLRCDTNSEETHSVCLQEAVATLPPEERHTLMSKLVPVLKNEMDKPMPPAPTDDRAAVDPSVPYKDAAFALLTYDKAVLVPDDDQRKTLQNALVSWSTTDFERRVQITSQVYAPEQIYRRFGAEGVKGLAARISADGAYDRAVNLIAELGDQPTKDAASVKLVKLAQDTESQAWIDKMKPRVEQANKAGNYNPTGAALDKQVKSFQDEQLTKVYASMKRLGGRPVVDYLLGVVAGKEKSESRRTVAAAALEGKLDRNTPADAQRILAVAGADDTPDGVRDVVFQRVTELPREQVAAKLYDIMASAKKWKIRWVAASSLLKMSAAKDVPEFFTKLPVGAAPGFAMSEPLTYGDLMGKMKPPPGKDVLTSQLRDRGVAQRLTAAGYFYGNGRAGDIASLQPLEDEKTPLPKVDDPDAKYQCGVAKAGGKPGETEMKEVQTVGEFVKLCVEPPMRDRK